MSDPDTPDATLDACGLACPQPMLQAKRALKPLAAGQILEVLATDPGAPEDLAALARRGGHELLVSEHDGERYRLMLRK
jgi:TusA-related sulfurtransferase